MGDLGWKLKRMIRQLLPMALLAAVLYGGYTMYRQGAFRHGIRPAVNHVLAKIPYFGSRFRHYRSYPSYASGRSYRRRVYGHRRHVGRRHHRRHR